jgi:outer membrane protein assembly factor BamB
MSAPIDAAPAKPPIIRNPALLRVWFPIVLLAAYWAFVYVNQNYEFSSAGRFLSRMGALLLLFLAFTIWWLSRRVLSWRDRVLAVVAVFAISALALFAADKSLNAFGYFLSATPFIITAWVGWLLIARRFDGVVQRVGFCALMLLVCGYFTLTRFEGLWTNQSGQVHWRWTNTSEQSFLATLASHSSQSSKKQSTNDKPWTVQPQDSPEFRGVNRDGVVTGAKLATDWSEHPPKELWRKKVGPSWSGIIVVDGHLVTQEQRGENEATVCYDAATGEEIWVHQDPARFEESLSGAGPRGTPTFANGRIYTFGGKGLLNCLKAETGEVIWAHDCEKEAEVPAADRPQWGYSSTPLVVDDLVIAFAGGTNKSVLAYGVSDGQLAWSCAGGKQSYSSPQLFTLHGVKQIVMHDNGALRGVNIADGKQLWELPAGSAMNLPMVQPHDAGNNSLVLSTEPDLTMIDIKRDGDSWSAAEAWRNNKLRAGFNDFVIHKDSIFALDDGVLCCIDIASGKRLWKKGRLDHGQILLIPDQDLLLLLAEKGDAILVTVDRKEFKELGRFKALEGKTWNSPVLVGNRLYARNGEEMAAFELNTEGAPPIKTDAVN